MHLVNGTSAIASQEYENLITVHDESSCLIGNEGIYRTLTEIGTFFTTETTPAQLIRKSNGKTTLPYGLGLSNQKGNIVWTCSITQFNNHINNTVTQPNIFQLENDRLKERVQKLETLTYALQIDNMRLKCKIEEIDTESKIKEETLMNIYKIAPFNWLFMTTTSGFLISFIFLFNFYIKTGAIFAFASLTLVFISFYSLWRLKGITLIKPKTAVIGFSSSFGLLITSLVSIFF